MIKIDLYGDKDRDKDREEVIELVLYCQNDGTRPIVGVEDQLFFFFCYKKM